MTTEKRRPPLPVTEPGTMHGRIKKRNAETVPLVEPRTESPHTKKSPEAPISSETLRPEQYPDIVPDALDTSRYRVKEVIGEGGNGIVFLAERTYTNEQGKQVTMPVAIKALRPKFISFLQGNTAHGGLREQKQQSSKEQAPTEETYFQQMVKLSDEVLHQIGIQEKIDSDKFVRLIGEGIVELHYKEGDITTFGVVEEYIDGDDMGNMMLSIEQFIKEPSSSRQSRTEQVLREKLKEYQPLSDATILYAAYEMLDMLSALHGADLDHNDFKPGNILIRSDGHFVCTDFGSINFLLEHMRTDETPITKKIPRPEPISNRTQTTKVKKYIKQKRDVIEGTIPYLPPEALRAEAVEHHAKDLYALGVTLYELRTGTRPFQEQYQQKSSAVYKQYQATHKPTPIASRLPQKQKSVLDKLIMTLISYHSDERNEFTYGPPGQEIVYRIETVNDIRKTLDEIQNAYSIIPDPTYFKLAAELRKLQKEKKE